ncbi:MAG: M60 family metallopeptidase, partial [Bacilli bacterium]
MKNKILSTTLAMSIAISQIPLTIPVVYGTAGASVVKEAAQQQVMERFDIADSPNFDAYNEVFEVRDAAIESFVNNGGKYGSSVLSNAFDGNPSTFWETGRANSTSYKNEVVVTFKKEEKLDRLVFSARPNADNKGFPHKFKIYASTTAEGDNFTVVKEGEWQGTRAGYLSIPFKETAFKRLKFEYVEARNNWASAGEFRFYKKDEVRTDVNSLFTDHTKSELNAEFASVDAIKQLTEMANNHPLFPEWRSDFEIASRIMNGWDAKSEVQQLDQFGNMDAFSAEKLKFTFSTNLQSTGVYAVPGETITVYVEPNGSDKLPSIQFTQHHGNWNQWIRSYQLKPGKNVLTVPEIHSEDWAVKVAKGGPIYFSNPYTENEQGPAPKLRIEGGTAFPLYNDGDDEAAFVEEVKSYKQRMTTDKTLLDLFEFNAPHIMLTGTTTGAHEAYVTGTTKPSETVAVWDEIMHSIFENYGLNDDSEVHSTTNLRESIRLMQPFGAMYAYGNHIGVQNNVMTHMLVPERLRSGTWGLVHEIGHKMDMNARLWGEVTNNMISQHINIGYRGVEGDRVKYGEEVYPNVAPDVVTEKGFNDFGYFGKLGMFWQLQLVDYSFWPNLQRMYRERNPVVPNQEIKQDVLVSYASEILGLDLSEYFDRYKFTFSDSVRNEISKYPKPKGKIWYLNSNALNYKGEGITGDTSVRITEQKVTATGVQLKWSVDKTVSEDVLGYEVRRDGVVIGFVTTQNFVDSKSTVGVNHSYSVTPYGKDLSVGAQSEVKLFAPTLSTPKQFSLQVDDSFNPLEGVIAKNYRGETISSAIVVEKNNVNPKIPGTYEVTYSVTTEDGQAKTSVAVQVVNKVIYASDMTPTSAKVGFGRFGIDTNPSGGKITFKQTGYTVESKKGLGTHANAEVVYDVSNQGLDVFEAIVGVEQSIDTKNSSVTFEVWADGQKVYDSGKVNG